MKRLLVGGALALGLVVGTATVTAPPASAVGLTGSVRTQDSGLGESSGSTFTVDDKARTVRARTTVTIRNEMPDSGGKYYFYFSYAIPVPAGVTNLHAESSGHSLSVKVESTPIPTLKWAKAKFSNLYYGHSRTITWTYTMKGGAFRSKTPVRVGPGFAAFPIMAAGDAGDTRVDVVVPRDMTFSDSSGEFRQQTPKGTDTTLTWRAQSKPDEEGIWGVVSARDPKQTEVRKIKVGKTAITLNAFPGDTAWLDYVEKQVRTAMPALEKTVGRPWPGGMKTIREDVASETSGYSWFDATKDEIVLGEDFDQETIFHEMTHAWVNEDAVQDRWLIEGLTQNVANRTVRAVGGKGDPHPTPKRRSNFSLSSWENDNVATVDDDYGYAASYAAVKGMLAGLDDKQVAEVLRRAIGDESAYEKPGSTVDKAPTDWRRLLDLTENEGATGGEAALQKWVVDSEERGELAAHAKARAAYEQLDKADGAWRPPYGLRTKMTQWTFPSESAPWIPDLAAGALAVQQTAAKYGLQPSAAVRHDYESFDYDEPSDSLRSELTRAATTTETVGKASKTVKGADDPASQFGRALLGADGRAQGARHSLDAGHLATAAKQARTARTLTKWAPWAAIALLVLIAAAVFGAVLFWRRFGDRVRAAAPVAARRALVLGRRALVLGRRGLAYAWRTARRGSGSVVAQVRRRASGTTETPTETPSGASAEGEPDTERADV